MWATACSFIYAYENNKKNFDYPNKKKSKSYQKTSIEFLMNVN